MATWVNGNLYAASGEKISQTWSAKARPLYAEWRGKGQFYTAPAFRLTWRKTPWTSASHKGGGGPEAAAE